MKTLRFKFELPSVAEIVAGLDPRSQHPPLAKAEAAAVAAETALAARRRELAEAERAVADLPARIQRGEARADALRAAIVERDACAMMIKQAETELSAARDRVAIEEQAAKRAVAVEWQRRADVLDNVATELSAPLLELRALALELSRVRGDGGVLAIEWPDSLRADVARGQAAAIAYRAGATS